MNPGSTTERATNDRVHDVVVVGGGMVGVTSAVLFGRAGLDVALVEAGAAPRLPAPDSSDEIDLRVSAVSPASRLLLQSIGAWPAIEARQHCSFTHMQVWDSEGQGRIEFDADGLVAPSADVDIPNELGVIVENELIRAAVWSLTNDVTGDLAVHPDCVVTAMETRADYAVLQLSNGTPLQARLVVAADGPESSLRRLAGIALQYRDYRQRALVSVVTLQAGHRDTAWQVFLKHGPLAFLPLSDGRCSIVWSLPDAEVDRLLALDEADFCVALSDAAGERVGLVTNCGVRAAFPLRMQHAESYVAGRVVLIGDAAHVIHPLAGQGVNLGFQDAAALVNAVLSATRRGRDPADVATLRRYTRQRRAATEAMIAATDGLYRMFGAEHPLLRALAGGGMRTVDSVKPLKRFFMQQAMGFGEPEATRLP